MSKAFRQIGVIVVDIQGDFTEVKEGSLAVPGTDKSYIETVTLATKQLNEAGLTVFATQDWHPPDHVSFYTNHTGKKPFDVIQVGDRTQVLWPPHCVQNTEKARILIDTELFEGIIHKGMHNEFDSYSGFKDDGEQRTEMGSILKEHGLEKLVIYGVATDYCVKATAIDAIEAGYKVLVIKDLCRGISAETSESSLAEIEAAGGMVIESLDIERIKRF
jgi:nicotinamidase/pyrazinamidase